MIYALIVAFGLRWLGFSATNLVERSPSYMPLVYAIPLVTIVISSYMLATNRQLHMPRTITRNIGRMNSMLKRRLKISSNSGGGAS